jgi:hypothetical protein
MPRRPRLKLVGMPLHIIQRGNNRSAGFWVTADYVRYTAHGIVCNFVRSAAYLECAAGGALCDRCRSRRGSGVRAAALHITSPGGALDEMFQSMPRRVYLTCSSTS